MSGMSAGSAGKQIDPRSPPREEDLPGAGPNLRPLVDMSLLPNGSSEQKTIRVAHQIVRAFDRPLGAWCHRGRI